MNQKAHLGKATSTLYSKELFFPVLLRLDVGRILGITCDRWNFAFIKKKLMSIFSNQIRVFAKCSGSTLTSGVVQFFSKSNKMS